jgi:threonyl-tRNA synthetase
LQRLYGTAFFDKKELEEHLERIEEAKRRDHRVLGKQLELFTIEPNVGAGLVLWLPKGAIVADCWRTSSRGAAARGYQPVYTPHIGRVELYKPRAITSRITPTASSSRRSMWTRQERYLLKPMNCPHHIMIYKSKPRSYRELPVRLAEFGTVYRYEQSGELERHDPRARLHAGRRAHLLHRGAGGRRVPRLHRDDAVRAAALGLNDYRVRLGFRDPERQVRRQPARSGSGPRRRSSEVCASWTCPTCRSSRARRRSTGRRPTSW